MTVSELISKLQAFDPNWEVWVAGNHGYGGEILVGDMSTDEAAITVMGSDD